MKALSDILTRMLMLMLLMLVACTNDDADEVTTPPAQEQYVTVRMNVPDMTVTASRAADGVIESITALSFGANGLLEVNTINSITNANVDGGYNGTFTLSVPQGTSTIHFLANLPYDVELPTEMGGSEVDVMTSLTTGDHDNLCYWGMADYNGNGSLFVTLYRNMAKITLASDPDFPFEGDSLYIAGLDNANESGKLVPYDNGFTFDSNSEFRTIPDGVTQLDASPLGTNDKEYGGYGRFLYVFEHENSNYEDKGLFVICQIGDAFYKVALTSDGVTPYPIIRNHEYIIYVSDVDDYQSDTYRSTTYYGTFEKDPINLEVWEIVKEDITAEITAGETLYYDSDDAQTATVSVTVPAGVSTLHIEAADFNFNGEDSGSYTYAVNGETNISLTFTLKNGITEPKTSTITISDADNSEYVDNAEVSISVTKTPAQGEENVIWGNGEGEGNTPIDWSGFTLSSELLEGYEGKILKMVVLTDNTTEYKQMHVDIMDGYSPTRLISFESNDYSPNELLEFDIELPNDLKDGLKITGYGVTFKKFYFNNNSTSSE